MNREVLLSILAMDAYQRGDATGILGLPNATPETTIRIGKTTLKLVELPAESSAAGFFAQSYVFDTALAGLAAGTTVISYRGTDFDILTDGKGVFDTEFIKDLQYGWTSFLKVPPIICYQSERCSLMIETRVQALMHDQLI